MSGPVYLPLERAENSLADDYGWKRWIGNYRSGRLTGKNWLVFGVFPSVCGVDMGQGNTCCISVLPSCHYDFESFPLYCYFLTVFVVDHLSSSEPKDILCDKRQKQVFTQIVSGIIVIRGLFGKLACSA